MNILILGSGGREHAFAWKIAQSPLCSRLFVAPGNAGTAELAQNVALSVNDFEGIAHFALQQQINLIVVGPEEPLVRGIRDYFSARPELKHIGLIGPDKHGAMLEGSKDFAKAFMRQNHIPTAGSRTFTAATLQEGLHYLSTHALPIVLKADGLAAGKGVIIASTVDEAKENLYDMLANKKFGEASASVVIEEFLSGIELSVFVLTDGKTYKILPEAKDYKRIGEGDTGLNTGGMGAVSPVPFADAAFMQKVEERIVKPTISGLHEAKVNYCGFIFIGLMNVAGDPYVIEYNVRMGDPETEAVIPRIKSDLVELLQAVAQGTLAETGIEIEEKAAATVMLVSGGYPEAYEKNKVITGIAETRDVLVFHAATKATSEGSILTDGGRVITVTGMDTELEKALQKAKKAASIITWDKKYYRKDIGLDILQYKSININE
jgi:phosphoribosylamine---glycine ligase